MENKDKYVDAFVTGLELTVEEAKVATMETVDKWDSIGQMSLIAIIEDSFNIELEMEDMMAFNSFENGIKVLEKYGIQLTE